MTPADLTKLQEALSKPTEKERGGVPIAIAVEQGPNTQENVDVQPI